MESQKIENFIDIADWPNTARVKLSRGKFANDLNGKYVFEAYRFADPRKGRFFYDLYLDGELYMPHVNPLFLDFLG